MSTFKQNYNENIKKYIGREVTVYIYNMGKKLIEIKGTCEGIDFKTKAAIIRTNKETLLIPKYLYIARPRQWIEQKK